MRLVRRSEQLRFYRVLERPRRRGCMPPPGEGARDAHRPGRPARGRQGDPGRPDRGPVRGVHVATGDILRSSAERGTELGRAAQEFMDRGDLVPDEVMIGMVLERVGRRTLPAASCSTASAHGPPGRGAGAAAGELDRPLDAVVGFEVGEGALRDRLAGRAEEQDRAEDDDERAIRRRLELFDQETAALLDFYAGQGLLVRVEAEGDPDEVAGRIAAALAERAGAMIALVTGPPAGSGRPRRAAWPPSPAPAWCWWPGARSGWRRWPTSSAGPP